MSFIKKYKDKNFPKTLFSLPPGSKVTFFLIYSEDTILSKNSQVDSHMIGNGP